MTNIKPLFEIQFEEFIITLILIMSGFKVITELLKWIFVEQLGIETKSMRVKREDHELLISTSKKVLELEEKEQTDVQNSIKHDKKIETSVKELNKKLDMVSTALEKMAKDRDSDKRAELKDRIGQIYRAYNSRINEEGFIHINSMEKEILVDLIKQYEKHGGYNSFVHSKVLVDLEAWIVKD